MDIESLRELAKDVHRHGDDGQVIVPVQTILALMGENDRLRRCINMAMGCLDPMGADRDVKLAWFRLFDAMEGNEPRRRLDGEPR